VLDQNNLAQNTNGVAPSGFSQANPVPPPPPQPDLAYSNPTPTFLDTTEPVKPTRNFRHIVPTILGILLLVGGVVTGLILVQQKQDIREKAAGENPPAVDYARCFTVKAYDTDWNLLSSSELSTLAAGSTVSFTISGETSSGTFDKAKFNINGTETTEITAKKPGSEEFYYKYTIPDDTTSFTISASIHHTILGWISQ
jgi:hypothetical protein